MAVAAAGSVRAGRGHARAVCAAQQSWGCVAEGNVQITPDPVAPVLRRAFPVIAGPKSGLAVAGVVLCASSVFRVRAVQLLATLGERESDHVLSRIVVVSRVATVWGHVKGSPGARQGPELAREKKVH